MHAYIFEDSASFQTYYSYWLLSFILEQTGPIYMYTKILGHNCCMRLISVISYHHWNVREAQVMTSFLLLCEAKINAGLSPGVRNQ